MNFFQAQDQARKQSKLLLALFTLALGFLVLITNICVGLFVLYSDPAYALNFNNHLSLDAQGPIVWLQKLWFALGWEKALWTTFLVFGIIFIAMAFKWASLRQGGAVIAESLGGTLIQPSTKDALEKRLLNVVEEIALASGVPVPQVYLLENELGINAFAAGLSPEDAVIGVTRGALISFNREQLQGVIAHEFSHILNGDMRLNMQLIAVLHGMLMIAESGYFFMRMGSPGRRRNSRDNKAAGALFAMGLALWLIGLIGQFFGAIIKAAVSRQREFLADASAVQFTRNASGIADALKIIGGARSQSRLDHHGAHELSHLFFSNANSLEEGSVLFHPSRWQLFATHPPLGLRIQRIIPRWKGEFIQLAAADMQTNRYSDPDPAYPSFAQMQSKVTEPLVEVQTEQGNTSSLSAAIPYARVEIEDLIHGTSNLETNVEVFADIAERLHHGYDASLFMMALFLAEDSKIRSQQEKFIEDTFPEKNAPRLKELSSLKDSLQGMNAKQILQLIELALPSLRLMSATQYQTEKKLLIRLIKADGKVELMEWLVFQLLTQSLDLHFGQKQAVLPKYKKIEQLAPAFQVVLSRMVHFGFQNVPPELQDHNDKRLAFIRAADEAGLKNLTLLEKDACEGNLFSTAVYRLQKAYPLIKPRILKSLMVAVSFDGEINDDERYMMTLIASVMDCPLLDLDEMFIQSTSKL